MRSKFTLISISVLMVIAPLFIYVNTARTQVVRKDLVSYWTFDESDIDGETVKDVWGDNHGTIMGDPEMVNGKIGDALEFDGNDYIQVPYSESLKPEKVTLSAWIYPKASGGNNIISSSGDHHPILGYELHVGSGQQGYMTTGDGAAWHEIGLPGGTITNLEWHYLTGVYDGERVSVYRNGEQAPDGWLAMGLEYGPNDSGIGGPAAGFVGIIDELCVYNRVLNEDEIKQNFSAKNNSLAVSSIKSLALTWGRIKERCDDTGRSRETHSLVY